MKRNIKSSIALSEDEVAILDGSAKRLKCSRSEMMRHLLLYHGLCGGDCPITTKILALPEPNQDHVIGEIRRRVEDYDPATPQKFRAWVKEVLGNLNPSMVEKSADALVNSLLQGITGRNSQQKA